MLLETSGLLLKITNVKSLKTYIVWTRYHVIAANQTIIFLFQGNTRACKTNRLCTTGTHLRAANEKNTDRSINLQPD